MIDYAFLCYDPQYAARLTTMQKHRYHQRVAACAHKIREAGLKPKTQCYYNKEYRATLQGEYGRVYDMLFLDCTQKQRDEIQEQLRQLQNDPIPQYLRERS